LAAWPGKGDLIMSHPFISVKLLVGNAATTGHHTRAVSPDYLLNKNKKKRNKRIKERMGLERVHL
jgi:hypothetical protein